MLIGKYISNLTAEPFEVSQAYTQRIYDQTSSPRLDKVLRHWERDDWGTSEQRQKLTYIILVELLSYQFASAVRWIETQDRVFKEYKFVRLIELGPGPALTGMASRTLKAKYEAIDNKPGPCHFMPCQTRRKYTTFLTMSSEPLSQKNLSGWSLMLPLHRLVLQ